MGKISTAPAASRRDFLKSGAAAIAFAGAGSLSVLCPRAYAQTQVRPFHMITLGDSIMWGQGLPEGMKFRNLVASWLQSQFGSWRKVVEWPTHAHSGAVTGWGMYPTETGGADPDTYYQKNPSSGYGPGYPYPGEVPFGYPSISYQIGMTVNDLKGRVDPSNVDLVLLDGGINDLSVANMLNVTQVETNVLQGELANGPNWVRTKTNQLCIAHMQKLLPQVISQFPNAAIVMTGYFPPISNSTDLLKLTQYLAVLGVPVSLGGALLGTATGLAPDAVADITNIMETAVAAAPALRGMLADRSQAFASVAYNGFAGLVNQANQGLPAARVGLAWPNFTDDNCYAGPNRFLFELDDFVNDELRGRNWQAPPGDWSTPQGIAYYRGEECSQANPASPTCYAACMGHPNQLGAQAYLSAVIYQLQTTFSSRFFPPLTATVVQQGIAAYGGTSWINVRATDSSGRIIPATVTINGAVGSTNQNIAFKNDCMMDKVVTGVNKNTRGSATAVAIPTGQKVYMPCQGTVTAPGYSPGYFKAGVLPGKTGV